MTELATRGLARARAARIRAGIQNYLHTLADIAAAYAQRDWTALGYADWQAYVDGEYSEHRLKLTAEHRQKAVAELRLAGMSTRAIGSALGVSDGTVRNDLAGAQSYAPAEIQGADGKTYAAIRPQTPAPMPEPGPEASTSTGPGHDHPPVAGEADARPAAAPSCADGEAPASVAPLAGAGDPLPAGIAEQIQQRIAEKARRDSDLDDPEAIAAQQRQLSSENVAKGLVALHFALDTDPLRWLTQTWQPAAYRERDLPRVRDAFTASGLRSIAKNLDTLADHLDRTGGSL